MNEHEKAEVAAFISTPAYKSLVKAVKDRTVTPVTMSCAADMLGMRLAIDRGVSLAFEMIEAVIRPSTGDVITSPQTRVLRKREQTR